MKLEVWPACIECGFIKLKKEVVTKSVKDELFGDYHTITDHVIQCVHAPVCSRIQGQKKIEGDSHAPMA